MRQSQRPVSTLLLLGFVTLSLILAACSGPQANQGLEREGTTKASTGISRSAVAFSDLTVLTADELAVALVGAGVSVVNATYAGDPTAAGTFAFTEADDVIGFPAGIILSSGKIVDVQGPNDDPATSTEHGTAGDADLDVLAGGTTYDAAVLTFEFMPDADQVFFRYVFGSEEYPEFVESEFNDVFGFFVNGVNCAVVGDPPVPVTINTINDGENAELFVANYGGAVNTEMDGFTVVLTCSAAANPGVVNTLKLAIADTQDPFLDSWVLIEKGSLTTTPPDEPELGTEGCSPGFWSGLGYAGGTWAETGRHPDDLVGSAFAVPFARLNEATLRQALAFRGGATAEQAAEILLRAAVAALLNAEHPGVDASWGASAVIAEVDAALVQGSDGVRQWRTRMLTLGALLDEANNLGCPLGN